MFLLHDAKRLQTLVAGCGLLSLVAANGCSTSDECEVLEGRVTMESLSGCEERVVEIRGSLELTRSEGALPPSLVLPRLERVSDGVALESIALERFEAPLLKEADTVWITGCELSQLHLPALERASIEVWGTTGLERLHLPALRQAQDIMIWDNADLESLELPALETLDLEPLQVDGEISLQGDPLGHSSLTRVDLSSLRSAFSVELLGTSSLTELSLPSLEQLRILHVEPNEGLESLELGDALDAVGSLYISHNPALPQCLVDALDARLFTGYCEGWCDDNGPDCAD